MCKITPAYLITPKESATYKRGINDIYSDILCILHLLGGPILRYSFASQLSENLSDFQLSKNKNTPSAYDDYIKITNMPPTVIDRLAKYAKTIMLKQ